MAAPKEYPTELRERAVRLHFESDPRPVVRRLAEQLGIHQEALRTWIRQAQADRGERTDQPRPTRTRALKPVALPTRRGGSFRARGRSTAPSPRWLRMVAGPRLRARPGRVETMIGLPGINTITHRIAPWQSHDAATTATFPAAS